MKETAFLQTLFMMLQGVISGEGFYKGLMELEGRMRVEIMESANVASDRWILTQMEVILTLIFSLGDNGQL